MTELRQFANPDGDAAVFKRYAFYASPIAFIAQLMPAGAAPATLALLSEIKKATRAGVLQRAGEELGFKRSGIDIDSGVFVARNWLSQQKKPLVYDDLTPVLQAHYLLRFLGYIDPARDTLLCRSKKERPALPPLSPSEKEALGFPPLSFSAPASFAPPARDACTVDQAGVKRHLKAEAFLKRLRSLYDAASAEWKQAGLSAPRGNPFKAGALGFEQGAWRPYDDTASLFSGSFWVAAVETPEGLRFVDPRGARCPVIAEACMFGTRKEAEAWGQSNRAPIAFELRWEPGSYHSAKGPSETLDALFALKEREAIAGQTQAPTPSGPRKRAPSL